MLQPRQWRFCWYHCQLHFFVRRRCLRRKYQRVYRRRSVGESMPLSTSHIYHRAVFVATERPVLLSMSSLSRLRCIIRAIVDVAAASSLLCRDGRRYGSRRGGLVGRLITAYRPTTIGVGCLCSPRLNGLRVIDIFGMVFLLFSVVCGSSVIAAMANIAVVGGRNVDDRRRHHIVIGGRHRRLHGWCRHLIIAPSSLQRCHEIIIPAWSYIDVVS